VLQAGSEMLQSGTQVFKRRFVLDLQTAKTQSAKTQSAEATIAWRKQLLQAGSERLQWRFSSGTEPVGWRLEG
jgi:hypothetical protein